MEITKPVISLFHPDFDLAAWRSRVITADQKAAYESPAYKMSVSDGVATIPINGPIVKHGYAEFGEVDPATITRDASRAMNDPAIHAVAIRIDCYGGTVDGTQRAGQAIAALASAKKTVSIIDDNAYSGGYWLASQASKIYMSGSTNGAGSIGVRTYLIDASKMYADKGVVFHSLTTGKFKAIGDPTQPVTDDAKAIVQAEIDQLFDAFVDAVASGRKLGKKAIREMEARTYIGQKAVDAGLVDAILPIEAVYGMLAKEAKKPAFMNSRAAASLALARAAAH